MLCSKKIAPKTTLPVKKETKEKPTSNENSNLSSDLTSQNTQVVISYPDSFCDNKKEVSKGNEKNDEYKTASLYSNLSKDILSLIVKLVSVLIWPVLILKVVRNFRSEIGELIQRIKSGKIAGIGVEFHEVLKKYEGVGTEVTPEQELTSDINPVDTVTSEWLSIETKINQLYGKVFSYPKGKNNTKNGVSVGPSSRLIKELADKGLLDKKDYLILNDLRLVRNKVAHGLDPNLSQWDVKMYLSLANEIKAKLNKKINQES